MFKRKLAVSVAVACVLSACAVGPDYQRPQMELPSALPLQTAAAADLEWPRWWLQFKDADLNAHVETALANNADLQRAIAQVDVAGAQLQWMRANLLPDVNAQLGGVRSQSSLDTGAPQMAGMPRTLTTYRGGIGLQYDIDLWGRVRRANEAARADLAASVAARETVRAAVAAQTVQAVIAWRTLQKQISALSQAIAAREAQLTILKKRHKVGLLSAPDLARAESDRAQLAAQLPLLLEARTRAFTALSLLRGDAPAAMDNAAQAAGDVAALVLPRTPALPAQMPAEVLARRADVHAAEQRLVAANARIGVTQGAALPSISLTGFLGGASEALGDLLSSPARTWDLALGLAQPLTGLLKSNADVAEAEAIQRAATADYRQAVQLAFKDVFDALSTVSARQQVREAQNQRLNAALTLMQAAEKRYAVGQIGAQEKWATTEALRLTEIEHWAAQREELLALVQAFHALGGGAELQALADTP